MAARSAQLALIAALVAAAGALACGGTATRQSVTQTTTPSMNPSAIAFPTAAVGEDGTVWAFVRQWQGDNISPILRPTLLPEGLETVTVHQIATKPDPALLSVEYSGPGKTLRISAGGLNSSEAFQDGTQKITNVRGVEATLEVNRGGDPRDGVVLWWPESGLRAGDGGVAVSNPLYEIYAVSLTEQEVLNVAASLTTAVP